MQDVIPAGTQIVWTRRTTNKDKVYFPTCRCWQTVSPSTALQSAGPVWKPAGVERKTGISANGLRSLKPDRQINAGCWCTAWHAWHSHCFKVQPRSLWGVLTLPFTCYCLSTPLGRCSVFHRPKKKSFSQKSPCCFPSLHLSVLTLHKQFLYWLRSRPTGDGEQALGHARDIQTSWNKNKTCFICQSVSVSWRSAYCARLPSSVKRGPLQRELWVIWSILYTSKIWANTGFLGWYWWQYFLIEGPNFYETFYLVKSHLQTEHTLYQLLCML